ncbi:putative cyclin-B3-1 isoform X1 [Magnolia sinica]|uniref:putative cyclin-B3-1 isoform X1 n=1 Tax=Magnolia sinica TaxID=86752 RepID=UPI00265B2E81|nr:putative cyclin-B3-1 isoform X1 [Magnolia sinica]
MVPFKASKGKTKVKESLAEDRPALKNVNMRDLKIYTDNEKRKTHAPKYADVDDKKKPVPSNVVMKRADNDENTEKAKGICDISVKTKAGRKALADVSNVRSYLLRGRLSNGSKQMNDKSDRSHLLQSRAPVQRSITCASASSRKPIVGEGKVSDPQIPKEGNAFKSVSCKRVNDRSLKSLDANEGKTASKPPMAARKSAASQRIWRGSSLGGSTTVITKGPRPKLGSIKANVKSSDTIQDKPSISGTRTRRKALVEVNSFRSYQLRNRSSDGSKLIRTQNGKFLSQPSKIQSGKFLSQPRFSSASQKVKVVNTSSRKSIMTMRRTAQTSSLARMVTKSKPALGLEKKSMPITVNSSMKEGKVVNGLTCEDIELVIPHEFSLEKHSSDGNGCSSESVTAIISKPKRTRRRSYTSLLMARSKVLGEHAGFVKQDELPNIDDTTNHLEVAEYVDDIYQYYWIMEAKNPSLSNYMTIQTDINSRMRGILINWLIEVHLKFELMQETLFLMVELLDRFLSAVTIKKDEMQLVGLTALLLASKYEDFWHPKIKDLISISSNLYTRDQMLDMEKLILKKLMFRLNAPTPYVFMLRFLKASQADKKLEHLAFYLIELCLVEYEALQFKQSLLCASAIYVARCTLQMAPAWTPLLIKHSRYEETQLRSCADLVLRFQRAAGRGLLKVTYEKYLSTDHSCVAAIKPIDKLPL